MLVKDKLQKSIEDALEKAMKEAFAATFEIDSAEDSDVQGKIDEAKKKISEKFAEKAKSCAADIATAIDDYIKSATITLNAGTLMTPMPTLISPAGPVTGAITLAAPTVLSNSIT